MVHVFTGNKSGAGTDANVFLTIYGKYEDSGMEFDLHGKVSVEILRYLLSGERELRNSKSNRNKFERNKVCYFFSVETDFLSISINCRKTSSKSKLFG